MQPGIGNPAPAADSYTLADMSEASLKVLRSRRDIACVLVNPLQALHPNASAPADSALVDGARRAGFQGTAYAEWLSALRDVCTERGIVLIFDEVFVGFRLAPGGAQEYFGVKADMVTYGKTPGRWASGRRRLWAPRASCDAFARTAPSMSASRAGLSTPILTSWARCASSSNSSTPRQREGALRQFRANLEGAGRRAQSTAGGQRPAAPRRQPVEHLDGLLHAASRYHWMLQYYLRSQGLALSWVGTGRLIFSLNYSEATSRPLPTGLLPPHEGMRADGWWWAGRSEHTPRTDIKRQMLREILQHRFQACSAWHGTSR